MKKAFTLIELLVVVLIIGILAAIALPQYQKAVHKARFAENLIRAKALKDAIDLYVLENGYPNERKTVYLDEVNPDLMAGLTPIENHQYRSKYGQYEVFCYRGAAEQHCQFDAHYGAPGQQIIEYSGGLWPGSSWKFFCYYEDNMGKYLCSQFANRNDTDIDEGF